MTRPYEFPEIEPDYQEQPSAPRFMIETPEQVDWYLRKRASLQAEHDLIKAMATEQLNDLAAKLKRLNDRFESEAATVVMQIIAERGDGKKTVKFNHGACSFRTVPGGVYLRDGDEALKHCLADEELSSTFVTEVPRLSTAALLEYAGRTGEAIPGLDYRPERESFSVRFTPRYDKPQTEATHEKE